MNKSLRIILAIAAGITLSLILVFLGIVIGRTNWMSFPVGYRSAGQAMGLGYSSDQCFQSNEFGNNMMGGYGMMESYSPWPGDVEPLTLDEANQILHEYIEDIGEDDFDVGEIMIFDNHAYAQIMESNTGIGAMEVLIDPQSKSIYPEQGPNMMWNLKYSTMGGINNAMMSGYNPSEVDISDFDPADGDNMPVSNSEAVEAAQLFLDQYHPDTNADDHAEAFYGYYTLHVLRDGKVIGMLSVNGGSSQVFYHNWHGEFIEMTEH